MTHEKPDEALPLLGRLELPEKGTKQLRLCLKLRVPGAGHFTHTEDLPLLSEDAMLERLSAEDLAAVSDRCAGALVPQKAGEEVGEVLYENGWYRYYLPVCRVETVRDYWKPLGYLPLHDGRFLVAAKKSHCAETALLLIGLLLLAAAGVILGFGWDAVRNFVTGLF